MIEGLKEQNFRVARLRGLIINSMASLAEEALSSMKTTSILLFFYGLCVKTSPKKSAKVWPRQGRPRHISRRFGAPLGRSGCA
ncbi:hypothetical protein MSL71_15780 [Desulfoluna butyratoxydans]|uniref:Uncharacterized protein n=1 Tax=Desulfoluna butyratoxydans TaxID=231438 RepID=A0A4U8YJJ8_9BACT|nr:hypothetical protein MSL71_15780 [Desulfoluna butyratoxydans]